jgi:pantoate--beta-alanine ligase
MQLFDSIEAIRPIILEKRRQGLSIGFVPTMGALHDGHLSLVSKARECDVVVVSIFVNPKQFNNSNDLKNYPRNLESDLGMLDGKCEIIFTPSDGDIYDDNQAVGVHFGGIAKSLEGEFRPGHFEGVGIIVAKLFNIIQPDYAYFGLKDLQQFVLIRRMVHDLSFPVRVVGCPTIRENSGLALSSRNQRLSAEGKEIASKVFTGLNIVKSSFEESKSLQECKDRAIEYFNQINGLDLEYLEIASENMQVLDEFDNSKEIAVCVAAYVEGVRLIDNLYLRLSD